MSRLRVHNTTRRDQPQIQIRISPELRKRLIAESDRRMVSMNVFIERAIEKLLDEVESKPLL